MKWAKVAAGDLVELRGDAWTIEKAKLKKRGLEVTIARGAERFTSVVDPDGKVKRATPPPPPDTEGSAKLDGAIKRKAAEKRQAPATERTRRPTRLEDAATVRDDVAEPSPAEEKVSAFLQGVPTATKDVHGSWVVPPVDYSTIAAHLRIFHALDVTTLTPDEMLSQHEALHASGDGSPFHRHGNTRQ
jgi:hypothetical protein